MKFARLLTILFALIYTPLAFASEESAKATQEAPKTIDQRINEGFAVVSEWTGKVVFYPVPGTKSLEIPSFEKGIPIVLALLAITALFLTIRFTFINVFGLKTALNTIRGKYSSKDDPGEISHFQALSAALSATVGLGNIAGVAIAISIGGAGATFWMILVGIFGMTTKFCECTLGVKYREIDENGKVKGGGMYYLSKGLSEMGLASLGKVLAVAFAIFCILASLGGGNMFQGNQAVEQLVYITGENNSFFADKRWLFGLGLAVFVGLCIIGGIGSIAKVTSKLVPFMCGAYILAALYILLVHIADIPSAFGQIFSSAFSFEAGLGGFLGVMLQGVKRAAFSNEAGLGSAPIAHSAVKTKQPASEGYVALLEPFVDTVIVCTMTALVIIITGKYVPDGASWTSVGSPMYYLSLFYSLLSQQ